MDERRVTVEATIDPKLEEFFEAGRLAYKQQDDLDELEVHFDEADRFFVSAKSQDPERVAEDLLGDLGDLKGYFADSLSLEYSPKERVGAFIRGFGAEAAAEGDLRTAISALDAILEREDPARLYLQRTLFEDLNQS